MPKRSGGCLECRKRKVRCDENRPECHTCTRRGTRCPGYRPAQAFILHNFEGLQKTLDSEVLLQGSDDRRISKPDTHEVPYIKPADLIMDPCWGYPSRSPASTTSTLGYTWESNDKGSTAPNLAYMNACSFPTTNLSIPPSMSPGIGGEYVFGNEVPMKMHDEPHLMSDTSPSLQSWMKIQASLPADWQWDLEFNVSHARSGGQHGYWTCTPSELAQPKDFPITIANAPVVIPVEYRWPPAGGVAPPPDPQATTPIDCRAELSLELIKDIFLTFRGSVGFYVLINSLLQVMVPEDFDTTWASSHLPYKYGGLKVCYIKRTFEPTMLPSSTETSSVGSFSNMVDNSSRRSVAPSPPPRPRRPAAQSSAKKTSLELDDFIEARPLSADRREKYAGRIGLKVAREGSPFVVMSTHIITEAILAKSRWEAIFGSRSNAHFTRLQDDWNDHTEVWAGDRKFGTIGKTFDKEAANYPDGFPHDVTLIKPASPSVAEGLASPVSNMGWLNHDSWSSLRQQKSTVKFLADTQGSRSAKSIKCSRPSDVLVVGEGIFLNQEAAAGSSKSLKEHKASIWNDLVSRAILYRVYPDFDPPNGQSGTALHADGVREDGTQGPGIVGFQSFVQRSGHVQNFEMEGDALDQRLKAGRVAFYGAFEVPAELKKYDIV